ncbi:hypothetical protein [uncultured Chryseobacterium sp.]|uniref:hypothetical protein n=1 Tax=uncultured Chryseobacterium sp. TaxID=259322 RepID=UPI0025D58FD0|nr:hypothetical protein [uncultured Chryseobacterium sp.]
MMKLKISLLFLLAICFINAQVSHKVKALAKPLENISYAESLHVGIGGEKSIIYGYFKKLSDAASTDDLYYFAKNGSNALRLYSGIELLKRNDERFLSVYQYYLYHPLMVKYQDGCVGKVDNIASHLKRELYSAKEIIAVRDSLLKEKRSDLIKSQLKSINDAGYKKLSRKSVMSYIREIEKTEAEKPFL